MASLQLEFPLWVQYQDNQYQVRPLLFADDSLVFQHERYEKALKGITKTLRKSLGALKVDRSNMNELLWLLFNPDFVFESVELEFSYGQRSFHNKISLARFTFQDRVIVCLPAFGHYLFIAKEPKPSWNNLMGEVVEHIQAWTRNKRKETGEEVLLDDYVSVATEFCTDLDLSIYVSQSKIDLSSGHDDFFRQFFRQNEEFDGRHEITRVGFNLNERYPSELSRAYYQEEKVAQLERLIYNRENAPLLILGPAKVGKSTLLQEVVYRHLSSQADQLQHHLDSIWELDPSRLIAGMSVVGMWQRRLEAIISFVRHPLPKSARQDKLYFNNVISLFRIGKSAQNDMTLSAVLKPYLQNRELQVILEATPEEWDVVSEMDRGFTDLFKIIRLHPSDEETTLKITNKIRTQLESEYNFDIDNFALMRLVELQKRFRQDKVLLGKIAENLYQLGLRYRDMEVDVEDIIHEFSSKTHLNPRLTDPDIKIADQEFYDYISSQLIGQKEAANCLADILGVIKAQLNSPDKPFGSFLFIGPTGVGKTQAAKVLANYLFTHEESLVRFDMNEFIDSQAVNRLVGDFYNPEGLLSTKIRYNPYCVLLFDEIEKAHPDVHNLLLQVLGEGRLSDALGRTISLCSTVIIMTSNLGAERVGKEINLQGSENLAASTYEKAIKDFFRPEFINRIDKTVIFNNLSQDDIGQIAWLQIKGLLNRHGFLRRHTILNVSPMVLKNIARKGFDPEMGGRALKRQIEKELTVLVAEQLSQTLPESPVIFNLYLKEGQLVPHIIQLEHIPASKGFLSLKAEARSAQAPDFEQYLVEIEKIKSAFLEIQSKTLENEGQKLENLDSSLLRFREEIQALEDRLRNILYEYELNQDIDLSSTRYRVGVPDNKLIRNDGTGGKNQKAHMQALYTQLQISEYMEEVYQAAERVVNESETLLNHVAQAAVWMRFYFKEIQARGLEGTLVEIHSQVENTGEIEVQHLVHYYRQVFPIEHAFHPEPNRTYLWIKQAGIQSLFEKEVGYHMFMRPHQSPIPVQVKCYQPNSSRKEDLESFIQKLWENREDATIIEEHNANILDNKIAYTLRLYSLSSHDSREHHISDLRSGLIQKGKLKDSEVKLWFYHNLPLEYQNPIF